MTVYKVAIVGETGVGKTSLVNTYTKTSPVHDPYDLGVVVTPVRMGDDTINVWEVIGRTNNWDSYLIGANAVIIMYDHDNYNTVGQWYKDVTRVLDVPIILYRTR